ncbi:DNA-methyltransferase [Micromonospora sediminicola]|uniref:DNA-methyltransferase n=1 Tax=Micromonospora sediminicola TaxID=946078 RepID=UPI003408F2ED
MDEAGRVLQGSALELLRFEPDDSFDLAYLDPPFFTQATHSARSRRDGQVRSFDDRWADSDGYVSWLSALLTEVRRVLRPSGAVMVHCDWRASHHIRLVLDQVFGPDNFRNEIIWSYKRWTAARNSLQRLHQTIHYYAVSPTHNVHVPMVDYSPTTNLDQIWHARTRDERGVSAYLQENGSVVSSGAKKGVPLGDVWEVPYLNPKARERTGYPTQKPLELLERLLSLGVQPGQRVLDPCCGSGTTLVAARHLGCEYLGIDISADAIALANERLATPVRTRSRVAAEGRSSYRRATTPDAQQALTALCAHTVQRNRFITGVLGPDGLRRLQLPEHWSVALSFEQAALHDRVALAKMAGKKQYELVLLFGTLQEDIFDSVRGEAPRWLEPKVAYLGKSLPGPDNIELLSKNLQTLLDELRPASMGNIELA